MLTSEAIRSMRGIAVAALPNETGGILAGRYVDERTCAVVESVSAPPPDSSSGKTWFQRGSSRLRGWLRTRWENRKQSYLGEWHSHPGGSAHPSAPDIRSVQDIASDPTSERPEVVLVIIGGDFVRRPHWHASVITGRKAFPMISEVLPPSDGTIVTQMR